MKKKMQRKNYANNKMQIGVIVGLLIFLLILLFRNPFQIENKTPPEQNSVETENVVQQQYSKSDIFQEIQFKERQIEDSTIPESLKTELLGSNIPLSKMKCMPEQIYINREGYKYSILQNDSPHQKKIDVTDKKILDLITRLDQKMPDGYTLSQLFACLTEDGRYIVKYNGIVEERAAYGYSTLSPVAFISLVFPGGTIQDASYISLTDSFCRTPIQLTENDLFYLRCDSYYGVNGTGEIKENYYYKVDLKKLNYILLSKCSDTGGGMSCE